VSVAADWEMGGRICFTSKGGRGKRKRDEKKDVPRIIETLNWRKRGCGFCVFLLFSLLPCLGGGGGKGQGPASTEWVLEGEGGQERGRGGGGGGGGKNVVDHGDLEKMEENGE